MRKSVALLLCVFICLGTLVPTTAVYVCSRMGGQRMRKMCCVEASNPCRNDSALSTHCCDLDVHHSLSKAAVSRDTLKRSALSPPTEVAVLEAAHPPQVLLQVQRLRRYLRPPSSSGPTLLRTIVLRI